MHHSALHNTHQARSCHLLLSLVQSLSSLHPTDSANQRRCHPNLQLLSSSCPCGQLKQLSQLFQTHQRPHRSLQKRDLLNAGCSCVSMAIRRDMYVSIKAGALQPTSTSSKAVVVLEKYLFLQRLQARMGLKIPEYPCPYMRQA